MNCTSFGKSWVALLYFLLVLAPQSKAQNLATVSYPGATLTGLFGINNHGAAVGYFNSGSGNQAIMLSQGTFTQINAPSSPNTAAFGINDSGDIVGFYLDGTSESLEGFLLSGGTYTTIHFPGSVSTQARGINNAGQIVGIYQTADGKSHGFELINGVYTTIDCPCGQTALQNINNHGTIVGYYTDTSNVIHGLQYNSGIFATVDFPGSTYTVLTDVNDSGTVVGTFSTATNGLAGFIYANGQFSSVNAPPSYQIIDYVAINDSGQIVAEGYNSAFTTSTGLFLSTGPFAYVPISNGNIVSVFDASFSLPVATIPVGAAPFDAAVSPDDSFVYVNNSNSNSVSVINPTTNTVVATIAVGSIPAGIAITPDSSTIYVATHGSNSVSVIHAATNSVIATVPVGLYPFLSAATPDGKYVYVTNFNSATVSVISTATNTVATTIPVGLAPQGIAISQDGKTVYVACTNSNLVYVVDAATNTVVQTIPISNGPLAISITPDGSNAYVSEYYGAATAVINLATNTIVSTIPVGVTPYGSAITPDGAFVWQTAWSAPNISVISTATNTVVATIPVSGYDFNVAIGAAPPTSQSITLPLSPTAPNQFNFTSHTFTVQYPAGTSFSGMNMTVIAAESSQATFKQRVGGTRFANATCILYSGSGGNCVDYQVSCSSPTGNTISCPSTATPSITVKTSFDTQQQIIDPGFLTTPIGTDNWSNIFDAFYLQRIDPTVKGRTKGFSEFVAVELGASNDQGPAALQFLWPLRQTDSRVFPAGFVIPASFKLKSIADPKKPVTDAKAEVSVQMVSDANGKATSKSMLAEPCEIEHIGGLYFFFLDTRHYAAGTYVLTVYGNAFTAQQVQFTIKLHKPGEHDEW